MFTPSIVVNVPVVVRVAPTPEVPLLYVIVPPDAEANVVVVPASTDALGSRPCATLST